MATVNIRRDVQDKFYRYKMPVLTTKIEGRGNGIKTVIPNMQDVARALNRPASYPTKFLGVELGAQATFNDETERYIVNGAHDTKRVTELIDVFIDKFVLCQSCKNPETELIITKDEYILADCKACGHRGNIDMRHKLSTFIVKNPPKSKKNSKGKKKAVAGADAIEGQPGQIEDESDDELTKKIEAGAANVMSEEAAQKLIAERENDEDWSIDTSAEAVAARLGGQGLAAKLTSMNLDDDEDDDSAGPYGVFGEWVKENKDTVTDGEIYKKAEESGIAKKHKTLVVLAQALFSEQILTELPGHLPLLAKLTTSEKHQKSLLGGLERLVGEVHPELVAKVPQILKALYDGDILEEEVIIHFGEHASKKYVPKEVSKKVRKAAAPIVQWLKEAESDDESD